MKITKILLFISLIISIQQTCYTQIGINTDDPDTSAILDIDSDDRGVLFPRISNPNQLDSTDGLFFYNNEEERFYYYNETLETWQCVNPFRAQDTSNIEAPGDLSVHEDLTVERNLTVENGKVTVKGGNLEVDTTDQHMLKGYGTTPIGGIIMWSGAIDSIPDGWALCDGKIHNGKQTPDLRGRFIVGYSYNYQNENIDQETHDSSYNATPRDTTYQFITYEKDTTFVINPDSGPSVTINIDTVYSTVDYCNPDRDLCQMNITGGNHINNAVNDQYNQIGVNAGESQHVLDVSELPYHIHEIDLTTSYDGEHSHASDAVKVNSKKVGKNAGSGEKAQKHKPDATIYESGNHYHDINGNTKDGSNNNLQGEAHENRPPYYVLAFIMRVK